MRKFCEESLREKGQSNIHEAHVAEKLS